MIVLLLLGSFFYIATLPLGDVQNIAVNLSLCLPVCSHISEITRPNFLHVTSEMKGLI